MSTRITCPSCKEEVEVTRVRTGDRAIFKYISFTKAVGICPNCHNEIHIPELDNIINQLQRLNKDYVKELSKYTDTTQISKDAGFANEWPTIEANDLTFETPNSNSIPKMQYYGTLKNEFGYNIVSLNLIYDNTLDDIIEFIEDEDDEREKYYFKTYVWINNTAKKVCCMMWLDVTGEASGIIFNETDVDAYRYGKQKVKDKYVIL